MWFKIISFFVVFATTASNKVSFPNITLEWHSGKNHQFVTKTELVNLQDAFPENLDQEISSIKVTGNVPLLHENAVSGFNNLTTLSMRNVNLKEVKPKAFKNFEIHHLALSENQLQALPAGVFDNVTLNNLQLYGNQIHDIAPGVFDKVTGLEHLGLANNKIQKIIPEVFSNPSLATLDLQFNLISVLRSGDLKNLPKLHTLDLLGNKIQQVPGGVFNNTGLIHLKLNYNQIVTIASDAFDNMPLLNVLHINHNNLTHWDNNWLHNCPQVAYIIAGDNLIETIPEDAFKNYPRVYSINLDNNKIKTIEDGAFKKSESIVNLLLRGNQINHWDAKILANVTISTVFLDDNQLKCIEGDLKEVFKSVYAAVHLDGNHWADDCPNKLVYFNPNKSQ